MTTRDMTRQIAELINIVVNSSTSTLLNKGLAVATDKELAAVARVGVIAWGKVATVGTCLVGHWWMSGHRGYCVMVRRG